MKMMALAGALLIAALAACGGGSSGNAPLPLAAATPTAAPLGVARALGAPVMPNGSPYPYVKVVSPVTGDPGDTGAAMTLASAIPVYDTNASGMDVQFSFTANSNGVPVATLVGTTTTFVNLDESNGNLIHWPYVTSASTIPCGMGAIDTDPAAPGVIEVQYLACGGNPF